MKRSTGWDSLLRFLLLAGEFLFIVAEPDGEWAQCVKEESNEKGLVPKDCLVGSGSSPRAHRARATTVKRDQRAHERKLEPDGKSTEPLPSQLPPAPVKNAEAVANSDSEFADIEKHNIVSIGGTDREGRPVIIVSAVRMPARHNINHGHLLECVDFVPYMFAYL
eukprot:m.25776 g.25776  ORF g.25776 m.25776 type:complete len:165 (+) comp28960_c0_seq1:1483-1977(+)